MMDKRLSLLAIDKGEGLKEIERENGLVASFVANVEECISERECKLYNERMVINEIRDHLL